MIRNYSEKGDRKFITRKKGKTKYPNFNLITLIQTAFSKFAMAFILGEQKPVGYVCVKQMKLHSNKGCSRLRATAHFLSYRLDILHYSCQ